MPPKRNPEITSRIMSRIKSEDTKVEIALGRAMWGLGLRYRKHYPLIGKPDFVFIGVKVAVFCDGDFWHGRNFNKMVAEGRFENNPNYWIPKMSKTIERDKNSKRVLESKGWYVIRIWETDVYKSPVEVAKQIQEIVQNRKINQE
ncbi:MAG: very short patch repair endonuclease [Chloroflexi bacterium]|nr:very short patch repair endonuclease [Chloroflexota bacterium]